jgi:hypothetical protein
LPFHRFFYRFSLTKNNHDFCGEEVSVMTTTAMVDDNSSLETFEEEFHLTKHALLPQAASQVSQRTGDENRGNEND